MYANSLMRGLGHGKGHIGLCMRSNHNKTNSGVWVKPQFGCVKLNFDGSSKSATQNASIGGVFRDHEGIFLLGYSETIGKATSSIAELVAARRGIELALENGFANIWIEGDAKVVVDVIFRRINLKSKADQEHFRDINILICKLNGFSVSHVYRKGNRVADKLAKLAFKIKKPTIWRGVPPEEVKMLLHLDANQDNYRKNILREK